MILRIEDITKSYGDKLILNNINLSLTPGIYGLLGANGAGKTTLFHILCGIKNPDKGFLKYNDIVVTIHNEKYRSCLGFLPQHFTYYPEFTALNFMLYMSSLKKISSSKQKEECLKLLDMVGLSDVTNKKIKTYSGGMKQRLGIAQALINNPDILILDEPTVGLDPKERVRFRNLISSLSKDKIVILSTHIVSDIEYIADEILVIKKGEIINKGIPQNLIKEINNKVWEVYVSPNNLSYYLNNFVISNQRNEGTDIVLRIVSETNPNPNGLSKSVNPTLEDLYLYYFREENTHEINN